MKCDTKAKMDTVEVAILVVSEPKPLTPMEFDAVQDKIRASKVHKAIKQINKELSHKVQNKEGKFSITSMPCMFLGLNTFDLDLDFPVIWPDVKKQLESAGWSVDFTHENHGEVWLTFTITFDRRIAQP